jgi:hypothetical protein
MLAPDVFAFTAPQTFFGLEIGTRMTVIRTGGDLLLYSPIAGVPAMLPLLGNPRWVLAPSRMHHLYVGEWMERGLESWAAPGLPEKRTDVSFDHVVSESGSPFGDDILLIPLRCFSLTNEVVMLHRPSRTLVVTDLVFHFTQDNSALTRTAMACSFAYPGCKASMLERIGMKRDIARQEIAGLLDLDFDRLVMAHGAVIETGGKAALKSAYAWLGV